MTGYYPQLKTRFLRDNERIIPSKEITLPFVIEPPSIEFANPDFLQSILRTYSDQIKTDIAVYGAVLLRGFNVDSTKAFEEIILSIQGMQGMSHLFMSEPGRDRVDGLHYVFHTNSKVKTGGTLHLGGFHTENYYSPDVPSYISFCCLQPAKWGGETGLIHMGRVYEQLNTELKTQLEKQSFFVSRWPISVIAHRYQIDAALAQKACHDFGLSIENNHFAVMYKPSVFKHPITQKKIIQANLCAELPALNDAILNHFMPDYTGLKWLWHKAAWKYVGYHRLRKWSLILPSLIRHPIQFFKMRKQIQQRMKQYSNNSASRIHSVFKSADIKTLASHMRDRFSSFTWQKGDVLLIDNLQVAHAGMPGKTTKKNPRKIRAMLCNPIKINYAHSTSGLQEAEELRSNTLGEYMYHLSNTIKV